MTILFVNILEILCVDGFLNNSLKVVDWVPCNDTNLLELLDEYFYLTETQNVCTTRDHLVYI